MRNRRFKKLTRIIESKKIIDEMFDKKTKEDMIAEFYNILMEYIIEKYMRPENISYDYLDTISYNLLEEYLPWNADIDEETFEKMKKELIEEVLKRIEE